MHWPGLDASPYAGQVGAIEAELTPKPVARTVAIMRGLMARTSDYGPGPATVQGPRYRQVVYLTAPAARPVVTRAVAALPAPLQPRIVVRDLPDGCLWDLPPRDLGVLLLQMIETGTGAAAYYTDIMQAVVNLALAAPGGPAAECGQLPGPPRRGLAGSRLGDGLHEAALTRIRAAKNHVGDIQLRYATLLGRLGPALDGPGTLDGADAWYCLLEGTREPSVAEAQAMLLTEVVAHAATSPGTERRAILLAADDYSAVSRRVPISNLYERGRCLGLGAVLARARP